MAEDCFVTALSRARVEGADHFIDPETGTNIALENGEPGRYGMMVRHLRLEDKKKRDRQWWRWAVRLFQRVKS